MHLSLHGMSMTLAMAVVRQWFSGLPCGVMLRCILNYCNHPKIIQKSSLISMISPERHHHGQCTPSSHRLTNATIITVDIHPDCFICYVLSTVWTFNLTAAKTSKKSLKLVVLNQNHPMLHPAQSLSCPAQYLKRHGLPKCTKLHQHAPDSSKPDYHVTLESTRFTVKTAEHWCIICRQNWAQQSSSWCIMCTFTFTSSNWSNLSAASQYFTCNTSEQGPKQGYVSGHGRSWDPVNL